MVPLQAAILEADKLRIQRGYTMFQPVNVFDICMSMDVSVRFIDVSMEGMYTIREDGTHPTIILSNQRPLPRRYFTCAHELGHHIFKHGNHIDEFSDSEVSSNRKEEILVDTFAAALLMPSIGIQAEFAKRGVKMDDASAEHYYSIASTFGVGYSTLVTNCRINKLISAAKEKELLRHTPAKLFKAITGLNDKVSHFKIIDGFSSLSVIDLEVSNHIILPASASIEGNHLEECSRSLKVAVFVAKRPGIVRAVYANTSSFIRIQNMQYIGLVENRHLEN
ncbi:MAG: ImmA/IrrE family metallo-endopeptidase [Bacteroidota bacterium]